MRTILVYGSLRATSTRGYNYQRFGEQNFITDDVMSYFKLYARVNGSYPAALYTGKANDKIIVEVHEVSDETFEKIRKIESDAGYNYGILATQNGHKGTMFYIDFINSTDILVESGNWV